MVTGAWGYGYVSVLEEGMIMGKIAGHVLVRIALKLISGLLRRLAKTSRMWP